VKYGIFILIGVRVAYAIKRYYATDGGRHVIDGLLLKLPVLA